MTELPDRLLRDALRPGAPATASSACVDADALAAWAEGTMSRAAREAFEIHAAGCGRCQALMAAMARTEPPPSQPAWRRAVLSWGVPLAAATAAVVIVFSLTTTGRRAPLTTVDLRAPVAETARQEPPADALPPAPSAPAPAAAQATASAVPPAVRQARKDVTGLPPAKAEARAKTVDTTGAASPLPPPALAAPSAAPAIADTRELSVPPVPAGAGAAAFDSLSNRAAPTAKVRMAGPVVIASPDRAALWRIVNGAVERTADGGATWHAQALGVDVSIRAGAAPAVRVCWLAGDRGVVLLTTDGVTFRRVGFPEPVDLAAIEATDDAHATVTTATGRRFSTGDGGQAWTSR